MEKTEVDQTIAELQKTADDAVIYKAIGSLLVKAEKPKVNEDLLNAKSFWIQEALFWQGKKNECAAK